MHRQDRLIITRFNPTALSVGAGVLTLTCGGGSPSRPTVTVLPVRLTVDVEVVNRRIGTAVPADFTLAARNNAAFAITWQGSREISVPGGDAYDVEVTGAPEGYTVNRSASCSGVRAPHQALAPCVIMATESPLTCDEALWGLTYRPDRLEVVSGCEVASGVVRRSGLARDGDLVLELAPDGPYRGLLREGNATIGNNLVIEIPCQGPINQADAVGACDRYQGRKVSVSLGAHVAAAARHVRDRNHGFWAELHGAVIRLLPR